MAHDQVFEAASVTSRAPSLPIRELRLRSAGTSALKRPRASWADDEGGREAAAWFEHDVVARFVLDPSGRVLRANRRGRELAASGLVGVGGVFLCPTHRNRVDLDVLLARLADGRETEGRILFRAGDDDWCVLKLLTTPASSDRVFAALCPVKPISADRIEMLRAVFGLTRSETNVLTHLAGGEPPKEIGRQLDMSVHTVRAHLRSLCMRMGVKGINGALRLSFQLAI